MVVAAVRPRGSTAVVGSVLGGRKPELVTWDNAERAFAVELLQT
jgi:hypothetical protein